jgi:hypothetical protein
MKEVAKRFASGKVSQKISPGLQGLALQPELMRLANTFVSLQQARHEADYDLTRGFDRREAVALISDVSRAFADWRAVRGSPQADTLSDRFAGRKEHEGLSHPRGRTKKSHGAVFSKSGRGRGVERGGTGRSTPPMSARMLSTKRSRRSWRIGAPAPPRRPVTRH